MMEYYKQRIMERYKLNSDKVTALYNDYINLYSNVSNHKLSLSGFYTYASKQITKTNYLKINRRKTNELMILTNIENLIG